MLGPWLCACVCYMSWGLGSCVGAARLGGLVETRIEEAKAGAIARPPGEKQEVDYAQKARIAWCLVGVGTLWLAGCVYAVAMRFRRTQAKGGRLRCRRLACVGVTVTLLLLIMPVVGMLLSCYYYVNASVGEARTFIGFGVTFWTVLAAISVSALIAFIVWPYKAREDAAGSHNRGHATLGDSE